MGKVNQHSIRKELEELVLTSQQTTNSVNKSFYNVELSRKSDKLAKERLSSSHKSCASQGFFGLISQFCTPFIEKEKINAYTLLKGASDVVNNVTITYFQGRSQHTDLDIQNTLRKKEQEENSKNSIKQNFQTLAHMVNSIVQLTV